MRAWIRQVVSGSVKQASGTLVGALLICIIFFGGYSFQVGSN